MLTPILTFIIPVCHPQNSKDWGKLKSDLTCTIKSIAAQDCKDWKAIIVANTGSDLPAVPEGFEIKYVDFPPNDKYDKTAYDLQIVHEAVRFDKGRRILAGMLGAKNSVYFMTVDCDDLVNRHLASFAAKHKGENGWYIKKGYLWEDAGSWVSHYADFSKLCGTSHLIRSDLFGLPQTIEVEPDYIRNMLGSHVFIREHLAHKGSPLKPLPFSGAVYRIGHISSHSKTYGLIRQLLFKKDCLLNPFRFFYRLTKFRPLTRSLRKEFWGE